MDDFTQKETLTLDSSDNKSYRKIPFSITGNCDRIEVSYSVNPPSSVVDLGMEREGSIVGWSGSERINVFLEKDMATPGYAPGLDQGEWATVFGIVACNEKTTVSVTIRKIQKKYHWYKGDLHNHSHHSDGRHCLSNIFRFSETHGFDFIAVTDHNCYSQNLFNYENRAILFIPGMELTTYWGHMNYLGVCQPVKDIRVTSKKDLEEKTREARKKGALVSLNHPFKGPSIWEFGYDIDFDTLEVWNGPWSDKNAQAVELWTSMLVQGKKIAVVGGSDSHGSKLAHSINYETSHQIPTTWIHSNSHSVRGLLEHACAGHVFISYLPDCPRLNITDSSGNNLMGRTVPAGTVLHIQVQDMRETDLLKIITEKGCKKEVRGVLSYSGKMVMEQNLFVRLEVYREASVLLNEHKNLIIRDRQNVISNSEKYVMASLSNPVYID